MGFFRQKIVANIACSGDPVVSTALKVILFTFWKKELQLKKNKLISCFFQ